MCESDDAKELAALEREFLGIKGLCREVYDCVQVLSIRPSAAVWREAEGKVATLRELAENRECLYPDALLDYVRWAVDQLLTFSPPEWVDLPPLE